MEVLHFKNGQCEQCGLPIDEVGALQIIPFWQQSQDRFLPYYLYVCDSCFDSRDTWCKNRYPDQCEKCNETIEDGEHYLEKTLNEDGKNIESFGIKETETCRIICHACFVTKK
jgi:hypothetical protein